jgi:hypothetical protein
MTTKRREQWNLRLERLVSLRELFARTYRYDRARQACRVLHYAYDRWLSKCSQVSAGSAKAGTARGRLSSA